MALIRSYRDVPPGGWRYTQPETGVSFSSDNYDDLIRQIRPHREYKGLPVESVELDVQRQLCLALTESQCKPEPDEVYRPVTDLTARLTTGMALSLGKAVVAALAEVATGKLPFATKEEAAAFFYTPAFEQNPIGVPFDPAELAARFEAGVPEEELLRRP